MTERLEHMSRDFPRLSSVNKREQERNLLRSADQNKWNLIKSVCKYFGHDSLQLKLNSI